LLLGNDEITFQARFNGVAFPVVVPIDSVAAVFAKENGQGMSFEIGGAVSTAPATSIEPSADSPDEPPPAPPGRPHLTRIK
jgi:stringent starvation protein B